MKRDQQSSKEIKLLIKSLTLWRERDDMAKD